MATYCTYDMKGIKSEFADWVSNISPEYTPFISMLKKIPVHNVTFHWQTDVLSAPNLANKHVEGSDAVSVDLVPTEVKMNNTQIMRKVVMVSDTANAVASYGREKELFYQLKKAAKELKRDNEAIFLLQNQAAQAPSRGQAGLTASFGNQIHHDNLIHVPLDEFEDKLFEVTEKLYMEGSEANVMMYSPDLAYYISLLQEKGSERQRIFQNDKRFEVEVNYIVDPLGQEYKCIPNRWVPQDCIYIFNPSDIAMTVLRAPQQIKLDKQGSSEKYMIEQEVGLRLDNPKAAALCLVTFN